MITITAFFTENQNTKTFELCVETTVILVGTKVKRIFAKQQQKKHGKKRGNKQQFQQKSFKKKVKITQKTSCDKVNFVGYIEQKKH